MARPAPRTGREGRNRISQAVDRLAYERELLAEGLTLLAGVDEAGRGPLAGPVVAAAVMFPAEWLREKFPAALGGLNDSKQLTEIQREH